MKKVCAILTGFLLITLCSYQVEALTFGVKMTAIHQETPFTPIYACITLVVAIITGLVAYDKREEK